ncbi:DUF6541 family protein [Arthrobacter sp. TB 23]|uniref:DUF6541 family protein n=1 Tax=Arthrobacter sp. TB 23 TaxID=494419 RepID=UPI0002EF6950|nr:DUF6541 family protein [Arthrobacter sp. TB 23]
MSWWQAAPIILMTLVILMVPGFLVARACGARGFTSVALAAPISVSLASVGAILAPFLSITWSPAVLIGMTVLTAAGGLLTRFLWQRYRGESLMVIYRPTRPGVITGALCSVAVLVPAVIIGVRFTQMFIAPENISQSYDNIFHLNALRYILDTGSGSSLTLGNLTNGGTGLSFYPAAWHNLISLVALTTGASIAVAVNAANIAIGAVVWPLSALFMVTRIAGMKPLPILLTGALAAAYPTFPYLMVDFGVLYPYLLSIALLPVGIGLAGMMLGAVQDPLNGRLLAGMGLLAVLPAIALAHPSTMIALFLFVVPLAALVLWRTTRQLVRQGAPWYRHIAPPALFIAYLGFTYYFWISFRPSLQNSLWAPFLSTTHAVGEALAIAPMRGEINWIMLVLTLVGLAATINARKYWWVLGIYVTSALLYVNVSSVEQGELRHFFTGLWYNDSNRLAALLPVAAIPLAVLGGAAILSAFVRRTTNWRIQQLASWAIIIIGCTAIGFLGQGQAVENAQAKARGEYVLDRTSELITSDELALIERLHQSVPEDALVVGNPWTGASLAYALGDRNVLLTHASSRATGDAELLMNRLDEAATSPEVCPAVQELGAFYALDFGDDELHDGSHPYPGLDNLANAPGVELIDREGPARLYEITACR